MLEKAFINVKQAKDAPALLMETMPVSQSYFFSSEIKKYFKKYPALNNGYNFDKLLRE